MNILMRKYFNIQKNGNINSDSNKVKKEQVFRHLEIFSVLDQTTERLVYVYDFWHREEKKYSHLIVFVGAVLKYLDIV